MHKVKMRMCRSYSNLTGMTKLVWNDYKIVRAEWKRLEAILSEMEKPKPHFQFDINENRYRPVVRITRYDEVQRAYIAKGYRLLELALYLYKFGYIAPDYIGEELAKQV